MNKVNPGGETQVEACSDADVQIARKIWGSDADLPYEHCATLVVPFGVKDVRLIVDTVRRCGRSLSAVALPFLLITDADLFVDRLLRPIFDMMDGSQSPRPLHVLTSSIPASMPSTDSHPHLTALMLTVLSSSDARSILRVLGTSMSATVLREIRLTEPVGVLGHCLQRDLLEPFSALAVLDLPGSLRDESFLPASVTTLRLSAATLTPIEPALDLLKHVTSLSVRTAAPLGVVSAMPQLRRLVLAEAPSEECIVFPAFTSLGADAVSPLRDFHVTVGSAQRNGLTPVEKLLAHSPRFFTHLVSLSLSSTNRDCSATLEAVIRVVSPTLECLRLKIHALRPLPVFPLLTSLDLSTYVTSSLPPPTLPSLRHVTLRDSAVAFFWRYRWFADQSLKLDDFKLVSGAIGSPTREPEFQWPCSRRVVLEGVSVPNDMFQLLVRCCGPSLEVLTIRQRPRLRTIDDVTVDDGLLGVKTTECWRGVGLFPDPSALDERFEAEMDAAMPNSRRISTSIQTNLTDPNLMTTLLLSCPALRHLDLAGCVGLPANAADVLARDGRRWATFALPAHVRRVNPPAFSSALAP